MARAAIGSLGGVDGGDRKALGRRPSRTRPIASGSRLPRLGDLFVALNGRQGAVNSELDTVFDELDRAVRKGEMQAAGMAAAEGIGVLPVSGGVGASSGRLDVG